MKRPYFPLWFVVVLVTAAVAVSTVSTGHTQQSVARPDGPTDRDKLSPPNKMGVAMGHLHYRVRDVEANKRFWITLGGTPARFGPTEVVKFPDVIVFLSQGDSSGGTEGSVVNHVAFRVQSLDPLEATGMKVQHLKEFPGVASVYTPEGERIELFDEQRATNLGFTVDSGHSDPVADRHNQRMSVPIAAHHIHLYVPEASVLEAKAWYVKMFGGIPGKRWRYEATDLPGINFNFSASQRPTVPTKGRMLDHIGFEVENLEAFCQRLAANGVKFDVPYAKSPTGFATALLTDPWGTSIELTEGLRGM
jgi:catechol 2,3-dioxygenase-like lactoylglutathione lyase family enzyme